MEINGEEYYSVPETYSVSCAGCVFAGDDDASTHNCSTVQKTVNCNVDRIIWKKANGAGEIPEGKEAEVVEQMKKLTAVEFVRKFEVAHLTDSEKACLKKYPHYYKDIRHLNILDVYRVLELFASGDAALDHAAKKVLAAGKRGAKDKKKDIQEAIDTLQRQLMMIEEDEKRDP